MPRPFRVAVCSSQMPLVRGGAEIHVEGLVRELEARGFETALVHVPADWAGRRQILENCVAWRLLDLEASAGGPVDLVIATRFPSYVVRHRHKVVWVIHQLRQVYDMLGTPYSDFQPRDPRDRRVIEAVKRIDARALGEARELFTNAGNTAGRLARFNGLDATPLYHPPQHVGRYRCDGYEGFVLGVGRLDAAKRFDLLVRALAAARSPIRAVVAGTGPERERLQTLAERLGVADRLELAGWVDDDRLLDLYARCRGVFYAPWDEDYGYVTLEGFLSCKPVVTCDDSGGVLELVEDGVTGFIGAAARPRTLGRALDRLFEDADAAKTMGRRGHDKVQDITWDHVIEMLTRTLPQEPPPGPPPEPPSPVHRPSSPSRPSRPSRPFRPSGRAVPASEPPRPSAGPLPRPSPKHRLRLAYASPLPPQRTGIADYSAELLPHLARHADIDLFVDDPRAVTWPGAAGFEMAMYPLSELPRRQRDRGPGGGAYDAVLYQLGNDARFHGGIWRMLQRVPGVVMLHEYMLHHLVREATLVRGDLAGYLEEHRYAYGDAVKRLVRRSVDSGFPLDVWSYPLFERVVDGSLGLLVHNDTTRRRLLASRPDARIGVVPHHLALDALPGPETVSVPAVRRALGVPEDALMIASFGFITPAKRLEVALRAFARLRRRVPEAVYVLAGDVSPYYDLERLVPAELRGAVIATGRLPLAELLSAMVAADVAVNLRHPTGGETSGTLIRLLGLGKPVVVSDTGAFGEVPDGCCARVALDEAEEDVLAAVLEALAKDPDLRRRMGANAHRHMAEHHTLEGSAERYATFLHEVVADAPKPLEPVPPLAPWPEDDVLTELVAAIGAHAADLDLDVGALTRVAEALVELELVELEVDGVGEERPSR